MLYLNIFSRRARKAPACGAVARPGGETVVVAAGGIKDNDRGTYTRCINNSN